MISARLLSSVIDQVFLDGCGSGAGVSCPRRTQGPLLRVDVTNQQPTHKREMDEPRRSDVLPGLPSRVTVVCAHN